MVSWDICFPWSLRWPDICFGDHCSFLSRLSTSCRSSLPTARFPGCLCLWYTAFLWAVSHTYLPRLPVLRLSSRVMVEGCTPIALAMALFVSPFCNNTEIVYLCSEVSCLYISNANLADFWETAVSLSCFFCIACFSRKTTCALRVNFVPLQRPERMPCLSRPEQVRVAPSGAPPCSDYVFSFSFLGSMVPFSHYVFLTFLCSF